MISAMSRQFRVALTVLALALAASACASGNNIPVNSRGTGGSTTAHGTPAAVVTIRYISFEPGTVTIHAGQTVEWEWQDAPAEHNVSFGNVVSPVQATGVWYRTFNQAGTYPYQCTLHIDMRGTVVVLP
jgi:plastocyanin